MRSGFESQVLWCVMAVCLAGLLSGCATSGETEAIQQNLSILNERQTAIESRLQGAEGASQKSGDLYARLEEIQNRMRLLNGRVEELEHKIDQLQRAQASAAPVPGQQPAAPQQGPVILEESPPPAQPGKPQAPGATAAPPPEAAVRPPAAPQPAAESRNAEQVDFDRANQLMQQKKYDTAAKEFQGFVAKYPRSDLNESALYNVGECYYSEKRYEDAIKSYQQMMDKYPKGSRVANALLKQAMGWQSMGEATMARIIYTRLVEKYPGTAQAKAAEKKLQQM